MLVSPAAQTRPSWHAGFHELSHTITPFYVLKSFVLIKRCWSSSSLFALRDQSNLEAVAVSGIRGRFNRLSLSSIIAGIIMYRCPGPNQLYSQSLFVTKVSSFISSYPPRFEHLGHDFSIPRQRPRIHSTYTFLPLRIYKPFVMSTRRR